MFERSGQLGYGIRITWLGLAQDRLLVCEKQWLPRDCIANGTSLEPVAGNQQKLCCSVGLSIIAFAIRAVVGDDSDLR